MSSATERAIRRMAGGQSVSAAAADEGVAPSTLYRAIKRAALQTATAAAARRIVIVGAGNLGRELAGWLRRDGRAEEIVFLDNAEAPFPGCVRISSIADYAPGDGDELLLAIASPKARERVAEQLGRPTASFLASSLISANCSIGAGSLLLPNSLVSVDAVLGRATVVNAYSSVGHDVVLGDFCTLSSHVDLCGHVKVGDRVFFGSGARVLPGLTIGDDAMIGAGAVVVKDVPAGAALFGNPARLIA